MSDIPRDGGEITPAYVAATLDPAYDDESIEPVDDDDGTSTQEIAGCADPTEQQIIGVTSANSGDGGRVGDDPRDSSEGQLDDLQAPPALPIPWPLLLREGGGIGSMGRRSRPGTPDRLGRRSEAGVFGRIGSGLASPTPSMRFSNVVEVEQLSTTANNSFTSSVIPGQANASFSSMAAGSTNLPSPSSLSAFFGPASDGEAAGAGSGIGARALVAPARSVARSINLEDGEEALAVMRFADLHSSGAAAPASRALGSMDIEAAVQVEGEPEEERPSFWGSLKKTLSGRRSSLPRTSSSQRQPSQDPPPTADEEVNGLSNILARIAPTPAATNTSIPPRGMLRKHQSSKAAADLGGIAGASLVNPQDDSQRPRSASLRLLKLPKPAAVGGEDLAAAAFAALDWGSSAHGAPAGTPLFDNDDDAVHVEPMHRHSTGGALLVKIPSGLRTPRRSQAATGELQRTSAWGDDTLPPSAVRSSLVGRSSSPRSSNDGGGGGGSAPMGGGGGDRRSVSRFGAGAGALAARVSFRGVDNDEESSSSSSGESERGSTLFPPSMPRDEWATHLPLGSSAAGHPSDGVGMHRLFASSSMRGPLLPERRPRVSESGGGPSRPHTTAGVGRASGPRVSWSGAAFGMPEQGPGVAHPAATQRLSTVGGERLRSNMGGDNSSVTGGVYWADEAPQYRRSEPGGGGSGEEDEALRRRAAQIVAMLKETPRLSSDGSSFNAGQRQYSEEEAQALAKAAGAAWKHRAGLSPLSQTTRMSWSGAASSQTP